MQQRLPIFLVAIIAIVSVTLFAFGGHLAAKSLVKAQQDRQLNELAGLVLRRAESSVRFAADALDEIRSLDLVGCDPVTLQSVRFHIYHLGAVKDIRVTRSNGAVRCSAFSETLEFDRSWPPLDEMLPTTGDQYRIFRVDQFLQTAVGVFKPVDDQNALVAILALNPALLDVMPAELRDNSNVSVELSDGNIVGQLKPEAGVGSIIPVTSFSASSDTYPFSARIRVDTPAIAGWNNDIYPPIVSLITALGISLSLLLARYLLRQESAVVALDRAIAAREFKPFMQPIFRLDTGEIVGAELLARWIRPNGEVIPPARFISLAEESGRIEEMTWHLLSDALEQMKTLLKTDKKFTLSVNVTPHHFMQPGFADDLRNVVNSARISHRQICVEITERQPFNDLEAAAKVVASLQGYGFKLALDDVGIGHSGLSHLQGLGADTIKIDKFFVDTVGRDATAGSIIQMLVRLARELNMGVVAEGIEKEEQIQALLECGVERGQGYVVSPPVPITAFLEMVSDNKKTLTAEIHQISAA